MLSSASFKWYKQIQDSVRKTTQLVDNNAEAMTDVHNQEQRSRNMAAIKSRDTKPEIWLRKRLHARGFRYRLTDKKLPGKPDLVFPKYNAVIFVHGCFWHMHDCPMFVMPKSRTAFWTDKLQKNVSRDHKTLNQLHTAGWRTMIVWECAIKGRIKIPENIILSEIIKWLKNATQHFEISGSQKQ